MNRIEIERIVRKFPAGTRIRLISMDDPQSPPPGTVGTVITVIIAVSGFIKTIVRGINLSIDPN